MLLALVVTSLIGVTSICGALRGPVEAMSREIFGQNWLTSKSFQVQPVSCCDLSILL